MNIDNSRKIFSIWNVVMLMGLYLVIGGLIPVALNQAVWSKFNVSKATWLNLITAIGVNTAFFICLEKRQKMLPNPLQGITFANLLLSIGCALLFYGLIDYMLDPLLHALFPSNAEAYKRTLVTLRQVPVANFINVCIMTPIIEETLMRGYVLGGLKNRYGVIVALAVSTLLFAVLHFNYIQTLSALLCGGILGLLYIKTESLFCCIAAHSLYNSILFFSTVMTQTI